MVMVVLVLELLVLLLLMVLMLQWVGVHVGLICVSHVVLRR